jgi:hypothetical protein
MTAFSRAKLEALLQVFKPAPVVDVPEGTRITVHATISRFSFLYEKIRNAVDYRDDHLLRKAAIVRILKRQIALEPISMDVAKNLIRELIAARYLPNATLPEDTYNRVEAIIRKFLAIKKEKVGRDRYVSWLLGIVAAEIEEELDDHAKVKGLVQFLFEQLGDRITVPGNAMDDTERRLQVYIACHRALFKADDEMLGYKLARLYHSAWMRPEEWIQSPRDMALQMVGVQETVTRELKHPLAQKFLFAIKPWAVALRLLRETIEENPKGAAALLENPAKLKETLGKLCERKYQQARAKLRRGTRRAIVYLFLTKMLIAVAIEYPVEMLLYKEAPVTALLVNIAFPPILMFFVGLLIRLPGKDNTERIQLAAQELLSEQGPKGREIRLAKDRGSAGKLVFSLVYAATFFLTFGGLFWLLHAFDFNWVSSLVFIFFLCIVSFFAFRLRTSAREFVVLEASGRLGQVMLDFFSLPILRAGQWLSESISRINILIFLFDFIIEVPYKIFLNVLEEWFAFLKEKKEELQ